MKNIVAKGRRAGKKVGAAYATYKAVHTTTVNLVDRYAPVLEIYYDDDPDLLEVARDFVNEHARPIAALSRDVRLSAGELSRDRYSREFQSQSWSWMPVPGVSPLFQVRLCGDSLEVRAPRRELLEVLFNLLRSKADTLAQDRPAPVFNPVEYRTRTAVSAWDGSQWMDRRGKVSRSFASVVLPGELQREIEEDIKAFTESRDRLQRLEIPWRRGYLLTGPPGTGKTSVSLAIAASLHYGLATLSLSDLDSDASLRSAIGSMPSRHVLAIEDIDAYAVSGNRARGAAADGTLSLSGLLNALDGFETPDGLVTIVTTNHVENLDPALTRSGRLDRQFHLDYIEAPELERLFAWFYEDQPPREAKPYDPQIVQLAPAEVAELFKQNLDDPEAGWSAVMERVDSALNHVHRLIAA